jgi:transposase
MVVTHITESRGQKDDLRDALKRAEELRVGSVHPVFKDVRGFGKLRSLADVYTKVSADRVRVQLRLKALYRGRGVQTPDKTVYTFTHRETWMKRLPVAYRPSAELMYAQLDALGEVKKEARKLLVQESHTHAISRVLETVPGLGEVRVAQLMAVVVSPYRFRTARQLWSYSGLGVVMRSTSDWVKTPHGWERSNTVKTRGLNRTFNRHLKKIFKGAATTVIVGHLSPLYDDYMKQTEQGTKPPMAKLTLARRIAAATLAVYKSKEGYDPGKHGKKT